MQSYIDALKAQNVSVTELDTLLSNWLTDAEFAAHMADVKTFTGLAHAAGLKVVMYHPSLELISPGGEKGRSFYKDDQGKTGSSATCPASPTCSTAAWALVYAHVPFDTVPSPGPSAADLARFTVLPLPNLQAVSDAEAAVLRGFVAGDGTVVVTGPAPTALDELGGRRAEFALSDVLGLRLADPLPASRRNSYGSGTCWYLKALPGLSYLTTTDPGLGRPTARRRTPVRAARRHPGRGPADLPGRPAARRRHRRPPGQLHQLR
ncbi:hypothetical protein [Streptomyces sp. CBMA123]|uniref:hypothetical protein n=1 Tax=Streptomyces sp. CBMA123 TaxID=1896313 RepID=UPI0016619C16|nr:hypothetical protein [Streptomyces sp. CBMA123]MBD0689874.1 hypothetical protein [Streptomyces sp. CBMA123]